MASERADFRQIVEKFYAKSLQIVLQSRIPAFASGTQSVEDFAVINFRPSSVSNVDGANGCWFNLVPGDNGPALEKLEHWCTGTPEPLVVDILVSQSSNVDKTRPIVAVASPKQVYTRGEGKSPRREGKSPILRSLEKHVVTSSQRRILLERWFVQFAGPSLKGNVKAKKGNELKDGHYFDCSGKAGCSHEGSGKGLTYPKERANVALKARGKACKPTGGKVEIGDRRAIDLSAVYKKIVIMLRSLYSTTRLLPAQSLFKLACSSQRCNFTLTHRILVSPPPLSESEEKHMTVHKVNSIESHYGRICLSVAYRHILPFTAMETSSPVLIQIIPDYVGSPATDHVKRISNDCHFEGPLEKGDVHSMSIHESGSSLPSSGCDNRCGVKKLRTPHNPVVTVDEKGGCTTLPINEGHLAMLPIKSGGHAYAEDEELVWPFAIDKQCDRMDSPRLSAVNLHSSSAGCGRLSQKSLQNAAVGTLVRMLKTAAPLQRVHQSSSNSTLLETSWSDADRNFNYLSDKDELSVTHELDMSIQPVGERDHWPNKTTADALEEFKLYKKMRDSLLS